MAVLLERRWVVSVLWASYEGATRFNEFKQALGSIPPGTLAQRLVADGETVLDVPAKLSARARYRLTDEARRPSMSSTPFGLRRPLTIPPLRELPSGLDTSPKAVVDRLAPSPAVSGGRRTPA